MRSNRDILESYGQLENHPFGVCRIWYNKDNHTNKFQLSYSSLDVMYEDIYRVMITCVKAIEDGL
jgi:hypothetical protein